MSHEAKKIQIRQLPIQSFLGDAESSESLTLAQVHSTGGSKNVWLDTYGAVGAIAGYTRQNQTAITGGDGPLALVGIYKYSLYQQVNGVLRNTQQLIGVFNGTQSLGPYQEIRKSDDAGVTWTLLQAFTDLVLDVPHFAQIGDILVITGPTKTPLRWDGTTLSVISSSQVLAAPVVTPAPSGNKLGNYKFRVVPVLTDGTRVAPYPTSALTTLVNQQAVVTWVAYVHPLLKSYEIYSTTGTDVVFFYEGEVDNLTLTFTCNNADLNLAFNRVLQEHGDAPPNAAICALHKQRMWYGQIFDAAGAPTFPRKFFYSDPGRPDSVYQDKSFVDCSDGESLGDQATGATGDFNSLMVLWLEQSVWTVSGTGQYIGTVIDFDVRRTKARVGTVSGKSVLRIPAGAKYTDERANPQATTQGLLAYFTPNGDIRLFDGDNDIVISYPVSKALKRLAFADRRRTIAVLDDSRSHATWIFPVDGLPYNNLAVTWNYRHGVWYVWEWHFGSALVFSSRTEASILMAGEGNPLIGGFCYLLWSGSSFDGQSYESRWMSKTLYGLARAGEMEQAGEIFSFTKRFRWLETLFALTGPLDIEVAWFDYEAEDDDDPIAFRIIRPGSPATVASAFDTPLRTTDGSSIVAWRTRGGAIARCQLFDDNGHYVHDRGIRIRIRAVSA